MDRSEIYKSDYLTQKELAKISAIVIGDVALDVNYVIEKSTRRSPENRSIVIRDASKISYSPGAAGNIGMCLSNLGIDTTVIAPAAEKDTNWNIANDIMKRLGNISTVRVSGRHIPVYSKAVDEAGEQIDRIDYISRAHTRDDSDALNESLLELLGELGREASNTAIVVADYEESSNTTLINDEVIRTINMFGLPIYYTSRKGIGIYKRASGVPCYLLMNDVEYKAIPTMYSLLYSMDAYDIDGGIVVTMGDQGCACAMIRSPNGSDPGKPHYLYSPTLELGAICNPCGCGDMFLSTFVGLTMIGMTNVSDILMKCNAAARVVGKFLQGTGVCTVSEMFRETDILVKAGMREKQTQWLEGS